MSFHPFIYSKTSEFSNAGFTKTNNGGKSLIHLLEGKKGEETPQKAGLTQMFITAGKVRENIDDQIPPQPQVVPCHAERDFLKSSEQAACPHDLKAPPHQLQLRFSFCPHFEDGKKATGGVGEGGSGGLYFKLLVSLSYAD